MVLFVKLISYTSVSAHPISIVLLPIIGIFFLKWPQKNVTPFEGKKVGVLRRFFGFFIDMTTVIMVILPVAVIFMLILEYIATGYWQWRFERESFRWWTDIPSLFAILCVFSSLFYYRRWHFNRSFQTIGQYLMGYKLVKDYRVNAGEHYWVKAVRMRKA